MKETLFGIGIVCTLAGLAFSQATITPKFDVAAVRLSRDAGSAIGGKGIMPDGRVSLRNVPLSTLIESAFDVKGFQIVGAPSWLGNDRYDVEANPAGPVTRAEALLMLQSLLEERFKLVAHRTTKEMPVYALSVTKTGHKLATAERVNGIKDWRIGHVAADGIDMPYFVRLLESAGLDRLVIDRTGLTGIYRFVLDWDPENNATAAQPGLFIALQNQLGLRLDSATGPEDVLQIESINRTPTDN